MTTIDSELPPPADDDELELEALALRRRRKLPLLTAVLTLAVVAAGAFIGGAEAQKHLGSSAGSSSSSSGSALAARLGGGKPTAVFSGGGVTAGTVSLIKGSTLYVTDASGNTVKVTTSAGSHVTKTVSGTLKDIRPGDTVVVRGEKQRNGSVAAQSISLGGGGFGVFGGNGGATGFGK